VAIRAKVLCENAVYGTLGAVAEHGWSVWLETPSGAFLFDTGQGQSIPNNARVFGVSLEEARAILISHHHSEQTGSTRFHTVMGGTHPGLALHGTEGGSPDGAGARRPVFLL
jgi:glyoxylase-like metal-dependent hydrolase (beta-lactamase superfamily II)